MQTSSVKSKIIVSSTFNLLPMYSPSLPTATALCQTELRTIHFCAPLVMFFLDQSPVLSWLDTLQKWPWFILGWRVRERRMARNHSLTHKCKYSLIIHRMSSFFLTYSCCVFIDERRCKWEQMFETQCSKIRDLSLLGDLNPLVATRMRTYTRR